jgi:hypothetical protein
LIELKGDSEEILTFVRFPGTSTTTRWAVEVVEHRLERVTSNDQCKLKIIADLTSLKLLSFTGMLSWFGPRTNDGRSSKPARTCTTQTSQRFSVSFPRFSIDFSDDNVIFQAPDGRRCRTPRSSPTTKSSQGEFSINSNRTFSLNPISLHQALKTSHGAASRLSLPTAAEANLYCRW